MHHTGLTLDEITHLQGIIARLDAAEAAHPSEGAERRVHPRISFSHPMWLNLPAEPDQPWVHVYSRNLSTGGLSFMTRQLFYADQHVVIAHELGEQTAMLVLCRVCFCRHIDMGIQEIGLTFVTAKVDPGHKREIPAEWRERIAQADGLSRQEQRMPAFVPG